MNAKPTALDACLARTAVIHAKLERLQQLADGHYQITEAGYAAVGKRRPVPKGAQKPGAPDALTKREPIDAPRKLEATQRVIRPGTKLAAIIEAMRNPGGAIITQMMAGAGWQAHTVRGAISGMIRKHLGYEVITERGGDRLRTCRIA